MKQTIRVVSATLVAVLVAAAQQWPEARITVRVIAKESTPMGDVDVGITFDQPNYKPGQWGSPDVLTRSGKTDTQGLFSAAAPAGNYVNYGAKTPGFYKSHGKPLEFRRSEGGRWQPWNPTVEVILKKIVNPIPMYARHIETQIPALDGPVGFDLLESDWVAPSGRGKVSDLIFKVSKRVASFHDFGSELQLTFANNGDGVQSMPPDKSGSELRSPYSGPELGYGPSISLLQGNSKEHGEYGTKGDHQDYFIRVRTVMGLRGEIASALYGKIYNGIEYFPVSYKTAKLRFTYYLNSKPNDRNIEFDPKRNLFTNLKPEERVTAP